MKNLRLFVIVAVIPIILLTGCKQPVKAPPVVDLLTYTVDCSDQALLVDVCYRDENNDIVKLSEQILPWTVSIELIPTFAGDAYLKAEIPTKEVFNPFLTGNADSVASRKLNDSNATFISSGVIIGDRVYVDPTTAHYADVTYVDTETSISLNADLFLSGNEDYNIYHLKTLTATITFNGETAGMDSTECERLLCCKVVSIVDR